MSNEQAAQLSDGFAYLADGLAVSRSELAVVLRYGWTKLRVLRECPSRSAYQLLPLQGREPGLP